MRKWLRDARKEKGMSLKQAAAYVGVSYQSISYYERGLRVPTPNVAKRVGFALNVDWTRFFEDDDEPDGSGGGDGAGGRGQAPADEGDLGGLDNGAAGSAGGGDPAAGAAGEGWAADAADKGKRKGKGGDKG